MLTEDIKLLFDNDCCAYCKNDISDKLLASIDNQVYSRVELLSEDVFLIYKKFVTMKQDAPYGIKQELFRAVKKFIKEKFDNNEYLNALFLYRFLIVKSELTPDSYYEIAELLFDCEQLDVAIEFLRLYENKEKNKPLRFITLANCYNLRLKDYKRAIKYYEKYLQIDNTKSVVYTILASLYDKTFGDISLKDQLEYYMKAYNLKPNDRLVILGLILCYEKLGDIVKTKKFYQKLLENSPTDVDYYNYGGFLISCGDFLSGHKYFTHRFSIDDINLKYPANLDINKKWDLKSDISDKVLLVHYEQGFGDTFMYCRFVPLLKNLAKKIIFVVQHQLYDLIKSSPVISDGIDVVSDCADVSKLEYDYNMALLDAPYVLNVEASKLPYSDGYLDVSESMVKAYFSKYLKKSNKLKVGIACSGNNLANYKGRDIAISKFRKLLAIEGAEFYLVQKGFGEEEGFSNLGYTFENFIDTACALKSMDIVISTDNVILNLAGALGVKTIGLFNRYTNFRWYKLSGENVGWYESVKPLQAEIKSEWSDVMSEVFNILCNELKNI